MFLQTQRLQIQACSSGSAGLGPLCFCGIATYWTTVKLQLNHLNTTFCAVSTIRHALPLILYVISFIVPFTPTHLLLCRQMLLGISLTYVVDIQDPQHHHQVKLRTCFSPTVSGPRQSVPNQRQTAGK